MYIYQIIYDTISYENKNSMTDTENVLICAKST